MAEPYKTTIPLIRTLLVEDDPIDAQLIQLTISGEDSGFDFLRVQTEKDMRLQLAEYNPHIILSDYALPGFSGPEALKIRNEVKPDVPFIFISGTIGEERAVESLKNGASDYVMKGNLSRLPHAIKQAMSIQKERRLKQKQQNELVRAYELLSSVFTSTQMMVAHLDTEFTILQVNRAMSELFGHKPEHLVGRDFFSVMPDNGKRDLFKTTIKNRKEHTLFAENVEFAFPSLKKGVFIDWSVAPTENNGTVDGVVFTASDVTEKTELEALANAQRNLCEQILNRAPDAVLVVDANGEIVFCNNEAERCFGYQRKEMLWQTLKLLMPDSFVSDHVVDIKRQDIESLGKEADLWAMRKDGSKFPVDLTLGPLKWGTGTGSILMIRDITEKHAQNAQIIQLSTIASRINEGVGIITSDFKVAWVNESFTNQTGYVLEDLKDRKIHQILGIPDQDTELISSLIENLKNGYQVNQDIQLRKKDGSDYWVNIRTTPVLDADGNLVQAFAIFNDISIRKKAELERDELFRQLEERVVERTEQLSDAYDLIQIKNKEVTDSIDYAKHIQDAFTPKLSSKTLGLHDLFVLDLPRDVLSGDFHWGHHDKRNNCTYLALGDCTGHGVPGALMTILAVQLLEQSLLEKSTRQDTKQVIMTMDAKITDFLGQSERASMLNDGMELVLFRINLSEKRMYFTNIARDVYHFRNGEPTIYKGDKSMVGGSIRVQTQNAEVHCIDYEPGDRVYLFSDGYVDQFGGEKGGKMMRRRKEAFLNSIQSKPFAQHKSLLQGYFLEWKNDGFQVDDVIVMGLEM